jgi:serpin B
MNRSCNYARVGRALLRFGAMAFVTLPTFSITHEVPLQQRLIDFGMQAAFSNAADFSGIAPGVQLSGAFHQATISVDEHGTEAAAATAVVGIAVSSRSPARDLVFDHPFVFFVRDVPTNALLFIGHYANPRAGPP